MQCDEFRQLVDSYINDELSIETNHQLISHLAYCSECRYELTARRELRRRLRTAFTSASANQMRPEFANRLRRELHEYALGKRQDSQDSKDRLRFSKRKPKFWWIAIAACLLFATGLGVVLYRQRESKGTLPGTYRTVRVDPTKAISPELGAQSPVDLEKTELARSAVGDHRDCAIHFRLSEKPIDLEAAGRTYDPVYINLTKVVSDQGDKPLDFELIEAHSCVFESRRFAHIVLKYHGSLVSVLVTDAKSSIDGNEKTAPSLSQSQVISCSQFDGYRVSCFQTLRHATFVVSDLSERENLALARALAPSMFAHITRVERSA